MARFAAVATAYLALLAVVELTCRRIHLSPETSRSATHVACGLTAACLPLLLGYREIALLGALFAALMTVSRLLGVMRSVHGVARSTLGEAYLPLGIALVALLAPRMPAYALAVAVISVADVAARVAGQRIAGPEMGRLAPGKTWAGSAAFAVCAAGVALLLSPLTGMSLPLIAAVGLGGAAVEALCPRGSDNLVVPPAVALAVIWL